MGKKMKFFLGIASSSTSTEISTTVAQQLLNEAAQNLKAMI